MKLTDEQMQRMSEMLDHEPGLHQVRFMVAEVEETPLPYDPFNPAAMEWANLRGR